MIPMSFLKFVEAATKIMESGGVPYVGMPCTLHVGSDSYAGKVLLVSKSLKTITLEDGTVARLRKDGRYRTARNLRSVSLGVARDYRDPSF
jgi:hypothetical protein